MTATTTVLTPLIFHSVSIARLASNPKYGPAARYVRYHRFPQTSSFSLMNRNWERVTRLVYGMRCNVTV